MTSTWVEQVQAEAQTRLEAAAALRDDLAAVRGRAQSRDRVATVTVGPSGTLVDVEFTAQAERVSPDVLRAAVLEAFGAAQVQAQSQVVALTSRIPGADGWADLVAGRVPAATSERLDAELDARRRGDL